MASPAPNNLKRGAPGKGLNIWTYEQRVCLDLLWNHERISSLNERARVFNAIFADHQAECGVLHGVLPGGLSAQYTERTKVQKASWEANWGRVCAVPKVDSVLRAQLKGKIDDVLAARDGDIIQIADRATPPATPMHRRRREDAWATPGPSTRNKHLAAKLPATSLRHGEDSYAIPGPSTRKHRAITPIIHPVFDDNEDDEDYTETPNPKRTKTKAASPTVIIPRSPPGGNSQLIRRQQPQTPTTTPTKKKKTGWRPGRREERATVLFNRRIGAPIWLTPEEYAEAMLPLVNVTEEAAHPNPPALLFRYWHAKSHGRNSSTEFISGRFARALVEPRPPPDCDVLDWNDVAHHLNNRGHDQDGEPSPFISTSNLLVWVIRMALKKADDTAYISVIDTSKLDHKSIYHVPPFYEQLKKKRCFFKGGFNYRGSHEVRISLLLVKNLIWHTIPSQAIVKTLSLQDIVAFAASSRPLQKTLRLDQLATAKSSATDIIKDLKQGEVKISSRVAAAMAQFIAFLGLDHSSSRDVLARAVMEIAQGWALKADGESQEKAGCFVKVFLDRSEEHVGFGDQFKLKHAFLHGIEWSCGDLNVSLKGREAHRQMKARASKRGLADTGRVLNGELDRAKLEAVLFERREERLQVRPSDRLLEGPGEVDEVDEEELALGIGGLGVQGLEQEGEFIRYEE